MEGLVFLIVMIAVAWLCFWVGVDPSAARRYWSPFDMMPAREEDDGPSPLPTSRFAQHPSHTDARRPWKAGAAHGPKPSPIAPARAERAAMRATSLPRRGPVRPGNP